VNSYFQKLFWAALIAVSFHGAAVAQIPLDLDATSTNLSPVVVPPPVEVTPVETNQMPVITNQIPVIKPKGTVKTGTSNVLSAFAGSFGGSYSVSGRTLRFPAPEATPRNATSWRRNLDFGMNMARGNTDTLRYSLGVDTVKEKDANTIRFRAHGAYGESDGSKDTENAGATLRYERQLTPIVYALANLDWMTDPIAELDYRFTGILSPGFHLIRTKTSLLNFEIGAGYVEEKKDNNEDGYTAGRAAIIAEKLFNDHVLGWATVEYIPKLADPSVFFINTELGLASYITRDLSLNICYQERYDSNPGEDTESRDSILSTALSLNF
jgi:putative salt-induced outer membrane protein YdiY